MKTINKTNNQKINIPTLVSEAKAGKKINPSLGLNIKVTERVASKLAAFLSESYSLMLKYQNYHWNVVGPNFRTIHDQTEEHYRELFESIDVIAEKIRSLGFKAPGTFHLFDLLSEMDEPNGNYSSEEMIQDLILSNERLVILGRNMAEEFQELGEEPAADLMISRMSVHEKNAWLWRSLIEG